MSKIIKQGSDICKAITNTSSAKFQYSFPKASRFPIPNYAEQIRTKKLEALKEKGENVVIRTTHYNLYKLPSTLSMRKTSFGFGKRTDFTKGGNYCNKSCYNPGTDFDPKNPHGPKYSFTHAPRGGKKIILKKKKVGEEKKDNKNIIIDPDGPSPARYNYLKPFGSDAPKISMKGRHGTPIKKKGDKEEETENKQEEEKKLPLLTKVTIQITKTGKYPISQIPNVNSIRMDKDKSKRTRFDANKNPAPCDHPLPKLLGGHIIESQYRSYEPISIGERHNIKDSRSNYPGPGSYLLPSDFGIYESKDADKYPKENVYPTKKIKFEEKAWRHNMKIVKPKKEKEKENEYNNDYDYNNNYNEEQNQDNNENYNNTPQQNNDEISIKKNENNNKNEELKEEVREHEEKEKERGKEKEEDKKSEYMLLKDILEYHE